MKKLLAPPPSSAEASHSNEAEKVGVLGVPVPSSRLRTRVLMKAEVDPWLLKTIEKMRFAHNHH